MVASWRVMTVSSWRLHALRQEPELHLHAALLLVEPHDLEAAGAQLLHHGLLAGALDRALLGQTGAVDGLVCECRGRGSHYAATGIGRSSEFSTRRRSSAGWPERVSAAAIVMWPSFTRPASEASIVCMPCWAPVWMSE